MVILCTISLLSATESRPGDGETETDLTDGLLDKSPSNTDRYISTEDDEDSAELHYNITHLNRKYIPYHHKKHFEILLDGKTRLSRLKWST